MKTIDFSYFIERYIAGEMNQNELAWFTKELEGNLSLQKEILLRKKTDLILERQDIVSLRNKLVSIEKSRKAEKIARDKLGSSRIRYAAIFTGLIFIGSLLFFSFRTENPTRLFVKYYETYENPGVSRSSGAQLYCEAIEYFNKKEFARAGDGFEAYLKTNPATPHIVFLNGISNMEIKRFYDAEVSFDNVLDQKLNPYTVDANWYLAMCYLATSDKLKAKAQLQKIVKSESIYKNKARQILRHL
jgi:TolA-binding protein